MDSNGFGIAEVLARARAVSRRPFIVLVLKAGASAPSSPEANVRSLFLKKNKQYDHHQYRHV